MVLCIAYIDRKKKITVTTLFKSYRLERDKDILEIFDLSERGLRFPMPAFEKSIGSLNWRYE